MKIRDRQPKLCFYICDGKDEYEEANLLLSNENLDINMIREVGGLLVEKIISDLVRSGVIKSDELVMQVSLASNV